MFYKSLTLAALALAATTALAAPTIQKRQSIDGVFSLIIADSSNINPDINYLQTQKLYFANDSAYLGRIRYEQYSEPLIVIGADIPSPPANKSPNLFFVSDHQPSTGFQYAYLTPGVTSPLNFTVPHSGGYAPNGGQIQGFEFDQSTGNLTFNNKNHFYACQDADLAAIYSYQIWWKAPGKAFPQGWECKGPIGIIASDPVSRGP